MAKIVTHSLLSYHPIVALRLLIIWFRSRTKVLEGRSQQLRNTWYAHWEKEGRSSDHVGKGHDRQLRTYGHSTTEKENWKASGTGSFA